MKAAKRVSRPAVMSAPPTSSMIPAAPIIDMSVIWSAMAVWGKWSSLAVPCSRKRSPATIRSRDWK